jgi:hypothetical protein
MTAPDNMTCPKCGTEQASAVACRRCGLMASRFAEARGAAADVLVPPDAIAAALWAKLEAEPTQKAHDAFVAHCHAISALPHAAARYRQSSFDERGKLLERIATLGQIQLAEARTPVRQSNRRYRMIVVVVLGLLLVGGVVGLMVLLSNSERARRDLIEDPRVTVPDPR